MVAIVVAILGAAAFAHMAPFPFLLEAFRPSKSLWHVKPQPGLPPTIYLTFDDGPNAHWTMPLLDALREQDVRATFFLIDEHITPETTPILRRIADEGHAIALHSGTRRLMFVSPADLAQKLHHAAARIESITGREPCRLFRPHAGWRSTVPAFDSQAGRGECGTGTGGARHGPTVSRHVSPRKRRPATSSSFTTAIIRIQPPIGVMRLKPCGVSCLS
jgi:peptidoglycan/xylan/chitin deacetylase (PgdA/CDA1 family)